MAVIRLKDASVRLPVITGHALILWTYILNVWEEHAPGIDPVLTSGNDATHRLKSKHYDDAGWDWRTHNLPRATVDLIVRDLKRVLGTDYDIVLEKDHLHAEHDPKLEGGVRA